MLTLRNLWVAIAVMSCPVFAWADGAIYTLPADGSEVVYDLLFESKRDRNGNVRTETGKGTLTIRSVGTEKINGEMYRWIEVEDKVTIGKRVENSVTKALIPVKHLGKGKSAITNVKRAWSRSKNYKPRLMEKTPIEPERLGVLALLLPKPLTGAKPLAAKTVMTGLGKLKCKGLNGSSKSAFFGKDEVMAVMTYDVYLSEKSPFGMAHSVIKMTMKDKNRSMTMTLTLTLKSVAKNVKSALPKCGMQAPETDRKTEEKTKSDRKTAPDRKTVEKTTVLKKTR